MKKNVKDLTISPINPRKISASQKRRLQQSIMLFPKMLYVRDIIVNKSGIVLAGNQRTNILKDILTSSPMDWMVILQENEKWLEMSEKEHEKVIDYWKNWIENPEIDVTEIELSEDEEKELMLKDNNEYGDFDYARLQQIYDEINLVNFGFDEGIFYNPDEDDTVVQKVKGSQPKKIDILSFGKHRVAVTKEEYEALVTSYNDYVDETGVNFGYIKSLIEALKNKGRQAPEAPAVENEDDTDMPI